MKVTVQKKRKTPPQRSFCVRFATSEEWTLLAATARRTNESKNTILREGLRLAAQQLDDAEDTADAPAE